MLSTQIYEHPTFFLLVVTDGTEENTFTYEWGKLPPEGQTVTQYLQNCKREAELLAQWEIDQKAPPTPIEL